MARLVRAGSYTTRAYSFKSGTQQRSDVMKHKQAIRQQFRDTVFLRDGHKCVFCNVKQDLDAHHITDRNLMPNGGYVKENGITLCAEHHIQAERYHITGGSEWSAGMHPDDLYRKINSSYQKAVDKSNTVC